LLDARDLAPQVVGHFFTSSLVFAVHLMAEGVAPVKSDDEVIGVVLLPNCQNHIGETVDGVGWLTLAGVKGGGHAKVGPVGQGVAVDKDKGLFFLGH
jgi:hypothetical protein